MEILVAEDSDLSRNVLVSILKKYGYDVIEAINGEEAVNLYVEHQPDIVLMDIMMPVMDGFIATQKIKQEMGDKFVPVIILTAVNDTDALVKAIEYGADDYLTKPYNSQAIHAKIMALARIRKLHDTIESHRSILEEHQMRMDAELQIAEHIYNCVLNQGEKGLSLIKSFVKPVSLFNGDIILSAHNPSGGIHIMLGDFTGHGLSAAIGAIPASEVFYKMTGKGFAISEIAYELNERLRHILPVNMFCAAVIIEINVERSSLNVWNGGMPDLLVLDSNGDIKSQVASSKSALGIPASEKFDRNVEIISLDGDERIFMCSDGLTDVRNKDEEKFGILRYLEVIKSHSKHDVLVERIKDAVYEFSADGVRPDDISLVEVSVNKSLDSWHADERVGDGISTCPSSWTISLHFEADALKTTNPIPLLLNFMMGIQSIEGHRERIYTVLSELFVNALDHGLLSLDSSLKESPTGFVEYYKERDERLSSLTEGGIDIIVSHVRNGEGWKMMLQVIDTGSGFDYEKFETSLHKNKGLSGRGIPLVFSLCDSLSFSNEGRTASARYSCDL